MLHIECCIIKQRVYFYLPILDDVTHFLVLQHVSIGLSVRLEVKLNLVYLWFVRFDRRVVMRSERVRSNLKRIKQLIGIVVGFGR